MTRHLPDSLAPDAGRAVARAAVAPRAFAATLLMAVAAAFAAAGTSAADRFEPPDLFAETARAPLAATPVGAQLAGDVLVVIGTTDEGRGHVASLDASTLRVRAERAFRTLPVDVAVDARGTVFVVGATADGATRVLAMDADLEPLGAFDIGERLVYPRVSVPVPGRLVVGSLASVMRVVDVSDPATMTRASDFTPPSYSTGVGRTWTSRDDAALFANLSVQSWLVAFDIATARQLGEIGYRLKGGPEEPFAVAALVEGASCAALDSSSFLVADARRGTLTLAEFDADFRSLDIVTAVETGLDQDPHAAPRPLPGGEVVRPTALVASACDSSVIWVGNVGTSEVIQYAVNDDYGSIEKIGSIELSERPIAFAVAPDADYALAVSADGRTITRHEPGAGERGTRSIGDPAVRELQRLLTDTGYPVGTIDGVLGPATRRALALYETNTGVEIDLDNLEDALGSIGANRANARKRR